MRRARNGAARKRDQPPRHSRPAFCRDANASRRHRRERRIEGARLFIRMFAHLSSLFADFSLPSCVSCVSSSVIGRPHRRWSADSSQRARRRAGRPAHRRGRISDDERRAPPAPTPPPHPPPPAPHHTQRIRHAIIIIAYIRINRPVHPRPPLTSLACPMSVVSTAAGRGARARAGGRMPPPRSESPFLHGHLHTGGVRRRARSDERNRKTRPDAC